VARLRVSRKARRDLVEIFAYIAEDNLDEARRTNAKLVATFEAIAQQPGIGRERPELDSGIQSLPVAPYVIYYRHTLSIVKVLRVLHGARDIIALLGPAPLS
jgi:toxin ParE1/3/4